MVDYATASLNGEPYAALIERKGFLPSVTMRFCSSVSQTRQDRLDRTVLARPQTMAFGDRDCAPTNAPPVLRMRTLNCGSRTGAHASLPLADAGVREADVLAWWKEQPFDLGIPGYAGNCTLCMLKGRAGASCFA